MHAEVAVKVTPRSSKNRLLLEADGSLRIWVTAAPTDGQANAAVCELVAKALGIAKGRVAVLGGETSRMKVLAVEGLDAEQCRDRLHAE
ncbi:MAG: uncharacterized protein QOJ65_1126 [Fimbriimonadaceae bacterium]|jgi:uncharacterized protein YggU (UPF0235/DUF167 family)|nr:uncharacterized protein [Fimbriimonadaceae bacterium]